MELLNHNKGYGQAYGFIAYEKDIPNESAQLVIEELHDRAVVLVDYVEVAVVEYTSSAEMNHKIQVFFASFFYWLCLSAQRFQSEEATNP